MIIYILQYKNGAIGRLISVDTDVYSTIKSIKKVIKQVYKIPIYKQSICLENKTLKNSMILCDHSIDENSTLYLVTHSLFSFKFFKNLFHR